MHELRDQLHRAADLIADYREALPDMRVGPQRGRDEVRTGLDSEMPEHGRPLEDVIVELIEAARPGLIASAGPRYFGFVVGGSTDAALAADVIATGWDQVAFNEVSSPSAIAFEDVAGSWLKDLLGIPSTASVGFVTGAQGGNTVGLAAGRWSVLRDQGWDVGRDGLQGAPQVTVVAGAERHATIDRSLRLLGLGEKSVVEVTADKDGAMDTDALVDTMTTLPAGPTIVCAQSGNVNTGAFDDLRAIAEVARDRGAWLHVDGAFGLWAGASPRKAHLVAGIELADSWVCDGHKWLNVPYDSGYAFCAHPEIHATAMAYTADYLTGQVSGREFGGGDYVPDSSRRARGFATWAAIRSLGRSGVADLVDRCCAMAGRLARALGETDGIEVVNDVVLNQVLIRVGDAEVTDRLAEWIQDDGRVWLGATTWGGERLLRVSVSNWSTTEADIDLCARVIAEGRAAVG